MRNAHARRVLVLAAAWGLAAGPVVLASAEAEAAPAKAKARPKKGGKKPKAAPADEPAPPAEPPPEATPPPEPTPAPTPAPVRAAPVLPARPSVAVFRLEAKGVPSSVADLSTEKVVLELRQCRAFDRVASPSEVAVLLPPEQQRELVACANDRCAVVDREIAGALGVTHIAVGSVGRMGGSFVVSLKLLELQSAQEVATVMHTTDGTDESALLDSARWAVFELVDRGDILSRSPEAREYFQRMQEAEAERARMRTYRIMTTSAGTVGVVMSFVLAVPALLLITTGVLLEGWMYAPALDVNAPRLPRGRYFPVWVLGSGGVAALGVAGLVLSLGGCGASWVVAMVGASLLG